MEDVKKHGLFLPEDYLQPKPKQSISHLVIILGVSLVIPFPFICWKLGFPDDMTAVSAILALMACIVFTAGVFNRETQKQVQEVWRNFFAQKSNRFVRRGDHGARLKDYSDPDTHLQ